MSSGRQMAISFPYRKHGRQDRSLLLKRFFSLRDARGNEERKELPKKRARIYDLMGIKKKARNFCSRSDFTCTLAKYRCEPFNGKY